MIVAPELQAWSNFYVITGTAAATLIGLQFVAITLIAQRPTQRVGEAGAAFLTPTVFHFGSVLLLSALLSAPWPRVAFAAPLWGTLAVVGAFYTCVVGRRMRRQSAYKPGFQDWLLYVALPLIAYLGVATASVATLAFPGEGLSAIAAGTLLLLFTGIHNAWDSVSYHVLVHIPRSRIPEDDIQPGSER